VAIYLLQCVLLVGSVPHAALLCYKRGPYLLVFVSDELRNSVLTGVHPDHLHDSRSCCYN